MVIRTSRTAIPCWPQVIRSTFSQIPGLGSSHRLRIATGHTIPVFSAMGILGNRSVGAQKSVIDVRKTSKMAAEFHSRLLPPPNWRPVSLQDQPGRSPTVPDCSPHSFFSPFFQIEASLLSKGSLGGKILFWLNRRSNVEPQHKLLRECLYRGDPPRRYAKVQRITKYDENDSYGVRGENRTMCSPVRAETMSGQDITKAPAKLCTRKDL